MRHSEARNHVRIATALLGSVLGFLPVGAQAPATSSSTLDGVRPTPAAPVDPARVYHLTDIENIDLYTGKVSVTIPLLTVGGRGEAQYTMSVYAPQTAYYVDATPYFGSDGHWWGSSSARMDQWNYNYRAGYGPGMVLTKLSGASLTQIGSTCTGFVPNLSCQYYFALTHMHLIFVTPSGAEIPLYSTANNNASSSVLNGSEATGANRGRLFVSNDGSGMTFEASADVIDQPQASTSAYLQPNANISGWLRLKNGVRYQVCQGSVDRIIDRHGNYVKFYYGASYGEACAATPPADYRVSRVVDSLGRTIDITYDLAADSHIDGGDGPDARVDRISYSGYSGAPRTISVKYNDSSRALRDASDTTAIFPNLGAMTLVSPPRVPVAIYLSNEKSYQVRYNRFSEVAKVILPTGASIEYDHDGGLPYDPASGSFQDGQVLGDLENVNLGQAWSPNSLPWVPSIYRRVVERRTYGAGATDWDSRLQYGRPETATVLQTCTINGPGTDSRVCQVRIDGSGPVTLTHIAKRYAGTVGETLTRTVSHYFIPRLGTNGAAGSLLAVSAIHNGNGLVTEQPPLEAREWKVDEGSRRVERAWGLPAYGPKVCQENTTLITGAASVTATRVYFYDQDASGAASAGQFGNLTDTYEFGYGAAMPFPGQSSCPTASTYSGYDRRKHADFVTDSAYTSQSTHLRMLPLQEQVFGPNTETAITSYTYDGGTPVARIAAQNYDATLRLAQPGDITSISRTRSYAGSTDLVVTNRSYDVLGNIATITDPKQSDLASGRKQYSMSYNDDFTGGSAPAATYSMVTRIESPSGADGDLKPVTTYQYDYYTGRVVRMVDTAMAESGGVTEDRLEVRYTYADSLERLRTVERWVAGGQAASSRTQFDYTDTPGSLAVEQKSDQFGADYNHYQKTCYDGFGRPVQMIQGASSGVASAVFYDGWGQTTAASNPKDYSGTGCSASSTSGWALTVNSYDELGRPTGVQYVDGSTASTSYDRNTAAMRDPAGKQRTLETDALGRLIKVTEKPEAGSSAYGTTYSYTALDELYGVTQGSQARGFRYDSLGMLRSATNPESGTTLYDYDKNGNVVRKQDGAGRVTCFGQLSGASCDGAGYDRLNRALRKSYSAAANTPVVVYCYDGHTAAGSGCSVSRTLTGHTGRLTGMVNVDSAANAVSSLGYSFDAFGRGLQRTQWVAGASRPFDSTYTYNADGSVAKQVYPLSERAVRTCYDRLGRVTWVSASGNDSDCASGVTPPELYASVSGYAPQGAIEKLQSGAKLTETCFNNRLQPTAIRVGTVAMGDCGWNGGDLLRLGLSYPVGSNNGNLQAQDVRTPAQTWSQSYLYDDVNRLEWVTEPAITGGAAWAQHYAYDQYGNRLVDSGVSYMPLPGMTPHAGAPSEQTVASTFPNNQWNASSYDAGNLKQLSTGENWTYDAENRQVCASTTLADACSTTNKPVEYVYDGEGRRVKKIVRGGATTYYAYNVEGELVVESGGTVAASGRQFVFADHLGSTRLITDAAGNTVARYDYLPFGEDVLAGTNGRGSEYPSGATLGMGGGAEPVRFTGKERDGETGLDYFGARYFSAAQGRFTSPDPLGANILRVINPQRWNMYAYGVNNPLMYVDPDGRDAIVVNYSKMAVGMGHQAIISVHPNGRATFAEFGPKGFSFPVKWGQHTTRTLETKVSFGANGLPTVASYASLIKELGTDEKQPSDSISLAYFKTSDADTAALDSYINWTSSGWSFPYILDVYDCRAYALGGLQAAHVDYGHNANLGLAPNFIFDFLAQYAQDVRGEKGKRVDPEADRKPPHPRKLIPRGPKDEEDQ